LGLRSFLVLYLVFRAFAIFLIFPIVILGLFGFVLTPIPRGYLLSLYEKEGCIYFAYCDIGFAFSNKAILSNILYSCRAAHLLIQISYFSYFDIHSCV